MDNIAAGPSDDEIRPAEFVAGQRRPQRAKYVGQTGTSMHKRMLGHFDKKNTGIINHIQDCHSENPPEYKMRPIRFSRTNLERTCAEGILMEQVEKETPGILMNSKAEGGRGKLLRYIPSVQRI